MRIRLMTHIPNDFIARRIEHVMQRDRQLDHAQPRAEMPANLCDGIDQVLADIRRDRAEVGNRVLPEVFRRVDVLEEGVGVEGLLHL